MAAVPGFHVQVYLVNEIRHVPILTGRAGPTPRERPSSPAPGCSPRRLAFRLATAA